MGKHLEAALQKIGKKLQYVWSNRVGRNTGSYRRAIRSSENLVTTKQTLTIGQYANRTIPYAKYVEQGHRQFRLPNRIRSWDVGAEGQLYKRVAFVPKGETKKIVRTITPASKGWVIPKLEGKHSEIEVPRELRTEIRETLLTAAKKDGLEAARKIVIDNLKKATGNVLKVKIAFR